LKGQCKSRKNSNPGVTQRPMLTPIANTSLSFDGLGIQVSDPCNLRKVGDRYVHTRIYLMQREESRPDITCMLGGLARGTSGEPFHLSLQKREVQLSHSENLPGCRFPFNLMMVQSPGMTTSWSTAVLKPLMTYSPKGSGERPTRVTIRRNGDRASRGAVCTQSWRVRDLRTALTYP